MSLVTMKLIAYKDEKFQSKEGSNYTLMINPESIKWDRSISYNDQQAPDSNESSKKYKYTNGETLSFDIVIDCTGVVDSKRLDLTKELKNLQKVIYTYNGNIHRPNFVSIHWGKNITFQGVLDSINTTYTYFKPDGTPLRAKVSLSFGSYTAPSTANKKGADKSPDMTHLVNVVAGDTLPSLTHKIYDTTDYYVQVAQFNKLNKFRRIRPGTQLIFPPIMEQKNG